jgi:hypothetical protein
MADMFDVHTLADAWWVAEGTAGGPPGAAVEFTRAM